MCGVRTRDPKIFAVFPPCLGLFAGRRSAFGHPHAVPPTRPPTHTALSTPVPARVCVRAFCVRAWPLCLWMGEAHIPLHCPVQPNRTNPPTHTPTPPHPRTHPATLKAWPLVLCQAVACSCRWCPPSLPPRERRSQLPPTHSLCFAFTHTHTQHRPPPLAPHPTPHHHTQHP